MKKIYIQKLIIMSGLFLLMPIEVQCKIIKQQSIDSDSDSDSVTTQAEPKTVELTIGPVSNNQIVINPDHAVSLAAAPQAPVLSPVDESILTQGQGPTPQQAAQDLKTIVKQYLPDTEKMKETIANAPVTTKVGVGAAGAVVAMPSLTGKVIGGILGYPIQYTGSFMSYLSSYFDPSKASNVKWVMENTAALLQKSGSAIASFSSKYPRLFLSMLSISAAGFYVVYMKRWARSEIKKTLHINLLENAYSKIEEDIKNMYLQKKDGLKASFYNQLNIFLDSYKPILDLTKHVLNRYKSLPLATVTFNPAVKVKVASVSAGSGLSVTIQEVSVANLEELSEKIASNLAFASTLSDRLFQSMYEQYTKKTSDCQKAPETIISEYFAGCKGHFDKYSMMLSENLEQFTSLSYDNIIKKWSYAQQVAFNTKNWVARSYKQFVE